MDGLQPVIGEGVAELFVGHQGGVNVLLATRLSAMFKRERDRRRAGLDLAHVKGHSGCPINDRADALQRWRECRERPREDSAQSALFTRA